ncbi:hypothetical protein [Anaerosporobacter sp.]|uniref:hypothetical protein n=1 Tax=Anaerosporobacter sp. TaxID=1872529 RepID=UPI00286EB5AA|nr:hypothetical protein [Anaerosporobacter sp.]
MLGGSSNFKEIANKNVDNIESKSSTSEKLYKELGTVAAKMNELFVEDILDKQEKSERTEIIDTKEKPREEKIPIQEEIPEGIKIPESLPIPEMPQMPLEEIKEDKKTDFRELFDKLFAEDFFDNFKNMGESNTNDSRESNIEKKDSTLEKIEKSISTPEGIKQLIDKHPEKAELWKSQLESIATLNDPEASPAEIRSAQAKLSLLKGQLMEIAVKDELSEAGFDVETQQRVVEGENGGTRPDVIAKNNTDHPIEVFGVTIQPGETLSVECKCGGSSYMTNQLNNHIPNQLSGHEGKKILLTTSDIRDTPTGLANNVCEKYDAKLVVADVSVSEVENAIKEVAES